MEQSLLTHKQKLREYQRRLYAKNRERVKKRRLEILAALTPDEAARRKAEQVERLRGWAQENPSYHAEYQRRYRKTEAGGKMVRDACRNQRVKRKKAIDDLKRKPCLDCGGTFPPECMDFDHREPAQKSFSVSTYGRRVGMDMLLEEIAKCDLVCANCHRVRTTRRLHAKTNTKEKPVDAETPPTIFQPVCSLATNAATTSPPACPEP